MIKVSAAFVIHNHQILLFHRDNKPDISDPNKWGLIGGHAEGNETPDEALLRETWEEISVTPSNFTLLDNSNHGFESRVTVYKVILSDEEVKDIKLGDEGQEVRFFGLARFEKLASAGKLSRDLYLFHQNYPKFIQSLLEDANF